MCWSDAHQVAVTVAREIVDNAHAAAALLNHGRDALASVDGMAWKDPQRMATAFSIAASALGQDGDQ
jgi:hypothetical protein